MHRGDPDAVSGSCLQPDPAPAVAGILSVNEMTAGEAAVVGGAVFQTNKTTSLHFRSICKIEKMETIGVLKSLLQIRVQL